MYNQPVRTISVELHETIDALKRCGSNRDLECGKKIHRRIGAAVLRDNPHLAAALITMYSKCRDVALAKQVFDGLYHRDVVTWTCLMNGYVENREFLTALDLFASIDCEPDSRLFVAALKACSGLASEKNSGLEQHCLERGFAIHKHIVTSGCDSNVIVSTALINMYSRCGRMDLAKEAFMRITQRDVVAWNSLIQAYVENGEFVAAITLFSTMSCDPNSVSYILVLKACGSLKHLEKGMLVHQQLSSHGFISDVAVANTLLDMYCKCGSIQRAKQVFDGLGHRSVVSWNSFILGYVEHGSCSAALQLFACMDCEKNFITYVAALKACSGLASDEKSKRFSLQKGILLHEEVRNKGLDQIVVVANTLVDLYSKCGRMELAKQVFDEVIHRSTVTWNCLIAGYVESKQNLIALDLFSSMSCEPDSITYVAVLKACAALASSEHDKSSILERGTSIHSSIKKSKSSSSDVSVSSSLVDMYGKCRRMDHAKEVFDEMVYHPTIAWNSLLLGYVENDESLRALELFALMDSAPDLVTFVALVKACASLSAVSAGKKFHALVCKLGLEDDQLLVNTLMDFYRKCGMLRRAEELFIGMQSPSVASWNTLLGAYSSLGDPSQVFHAVKQMRRGFVPPNGITFICVLSACSRFGLVDKAKLYFEMMVRTGVHPGVEHTNCMVDMLGRVNRLEEALALVEMLQFDEISWMTLLGACNKWKNLEVGKAAFDKLVAAGTKQSSAYVLMSGILR